MYAELEWNLGKWFTPLITWNRRANRFKIEEHQREFPLLQCLLDARPVDIAFATSMDFYHSFLEWTEVFKSGVTNFDNALLIYFPLLVPNLRKVKNTGLRGIVWVNGS